MKFKKFYEEELGFCGCGRPQDIASMFKKHMNLISLSSKDRWDNEDNKKTISSDEHLLVLYILDSKKIIEHGGSVYGGWLSESGKEMLKELNSHENLESLFDEEVVQ